MKTIGRFKSIAFISIMVVSISACTSTRVAALGKSTGENIEVYTTKIPDRKYQELVYLQTDGSIFHSPQQLLKGLKKKAIELQADAIIDVRFDYQAWYPFASAVAIKYTE